MWKLIFCLSVLLFNFNVYAQDNTNNGWDNNNQTANTGGAGTPSGLATEDTEISPGTILIEEFDAKIPDRDNEGTDKDIGVTLSILSLETYSINNNTGNFIPNTNDNNVSSIEKILKQNIEIGQAEYTALSYTYTTYETNADGNKILDAEGNAITKLAYLDLSKFVISGKARLNNQTIISGSMQTAGGDNSNNTSNAFFVEGNQIHINYGLRLTYKTKDNKNIISIFFHEPSGKSDYSGRIEDKRDGKGLSISRSITKNKYVLNLEMEIFNAMWKSKTPEEATAINSLNTLSLMTHLSTKNAGFSVDGVLTLAKQQQDICLENNSNLSLFTSVKISQSLLRNRIVVYAGGTVNYNINSQTSQFCIETGARYKINDYLFITGKAGYGTPVNKSTDWTYYAQQTNGASTPNFYVGTGFGATCGRLTSSVNVTGYQMPNTTNTSTSLCNGIGLTPTIKVQYRLFK